MSGGGEAGTVMGFHHVGISVSDIARSIAFYRDVFGMAQACEIMPFGGERFERIMALAGASGRLCVMAKGNLMLELFQFDAPMPAAKDPAYPVADHGLTHFGVWVEDIDATFARMQSAGVRFHSPVQQFDGGMRAAYGRDPDGNVFELLERGEPPERGI